MRDLATSVSCIDERKVNEATLLGQCRSRSLRYLHLPLRIIIFSTSSRTLLSLFGVLTAPSLCARLSAAYFADSRQEPTHANLQLTIVVVGWHDSSDLRSCERAVKAKLSREDVLEKVARLTRREFGRKSIREKRGEAREDVYEEGQSRKRDRGQRTHALGRVRRRPFRPT